MAEIVTRVHGVFSALALNCVHLGPSSSQVELYWVPDWQTGFGTSVSASHAVEMLVAAYLHELRVKVSYDAGSMVITKVEFDGRAGYAFASPQATLPAGPAGAQGPQGVQGIQGPPGVPGANGANGVNGVNGANGANGVNGAAGVSVTSAVDHFTGTGGGQVTSIPVASLTPLPVGATTRRLTALNAVLRATAAVAPPILGVFQAFIAPTAVAGAYAVTVWDPATGAEYFPSGLEVVHLDIASYFSA